MKYTETDIKTLVSAVLESSKYRCVCPDLIRRIGAKELAARPSFKIAIQETKSRLHQVAGAYLASTPNYAKWRVELAEASGPVELKAQSLKWMQSHASTRERLPILERFYAEVLLEIAPVHSIIDIACGLNPLAVPCMGLPSNVRYRAYDLYSDMSAFLSDFLQTAGIDGEARVRDCAANPPDEKADLAIVLKFMPVLEQIEKGATLAWLNRLNARFLLVSFPTRSLGGRGKGMAHNYEARFLEAVGGENWGMRRFIFDSELCFVVSR